jgi:hypothetical protein
MYTKIFGSIIVLIFGCLALGADDWVVGEFNKLDQLHIEIDDAGFMAKVSGPPKVVAEFVECYFDNISDQYRLEPKFRRVVEKEMKKAEEKGRVSIALYRDHSYNAFHETTGWKYARSN